MEKWILDELIYSQRTSHVIRIDSRGSWFTLVCYLPENLRSQFRICRCLAGKMSHKDQVYIKRMDTKKQTVILSSLANRGLYDVTSSKENLTSIYPLGSKQRNKQFRQWQCDKETDGEKWCWSGTSSQHPQTPGQHLHPLPGRNTVSDRTSASTDICGSYDIDSVHWHTVLLSTSVWEMCLWADKTNRYTHSRCTAGECIFVPRVLSSPTP